MSPHPGARETTPWRGHTCRTLQLLFLYLIGPSQGIAASRSIGLTTANGVRWKAASSNGSLSFEATVPGSVHLDLIGSGLLPSDLYYRYNEVETSWVAHTPFIYTASFDLPSQPISLGSEVRASLCAGWCGAQHPFADFSRLP